MIHIFAVQYCLQMTTEKEKERKEQEEMEKEKDSSHKLSKQVHQTASPLHL